ncbi:MAG: hypothetical protein Q6373_000950 [Candidatus Sigynarchaeota archaeon]
MIDAFTGAVFAPGMNMIMIPTEIFADTKLHENPGHQDHGRRVVLEAHRKVNSSHYLLLDFEHVLRDHVVPNRIEPK